MAAKRQFPYESGFSSTPSPKRPRTTTLNITCQSCAFIFTQQGHDHLNSSKGFRHKTRSEYAQSKSQGCQMCTYILFVLAKNSHDKFTVKDDDCLVLRNFSHIYLSDCSQHPDRRSGIHGLKGFWESDINTCVITMCTFAKKDDPIAAMVSRRPLRRNLQSQTVFCAAKSLLKECIDPKHPHTQCQYSRSHVLPMRVVDVGTTANNNDNESSVRLQVNDMETRGQYLALSYCWGKQPKPSAPVQPVLLRTATLNQMTTKIEVDTLQQSIQDAIFVTRKLGFRYLWVDALCIIQDSAQDKDVQVSRMATIYKNATITIAAASSKAAAEGFLMNKSIQPFLPQHKFSIPMTDGHTGSVYVTAETYSPEHVLDTRGWVLQEFMLSSRMLIFSDYEVLWQCKELDLRGVTGKGIEYLQPLDDLPWAVFEEEDDSSYGSLDVDKLYLWKMVVQQYTERDLTDKQDRLRAMQGITTELETLWRNINIYGSWKQWFVQLLAWRKRPTELVTKRYLKRAPSWSWVSVDGAICYTQRLTKEDAKILTLTVSTVKLCCRVLEDACIEADLADTIVEYPDVQNLQLEMNQQKQLKNKETTYLLLGSYETNDGTMHSVSLLAVDIGDGIYRRLGLAILKDMDIWRGASLRNITLEPKHVG